MIEMRTANEQDMNNIVKVINKAFAPNRDYAFDIVRSQPKVYKSEKDYSSIHTVITDNEKIVSVAARLKSYVKVNGKTYPFSILGSVATAPRHQGKGYMKMLVDKIVNEDNVKDNVVFSLLTGLRHRYNYFGYEKCGYRYYFDIDSNFCKYQESLPGLKLVPYKNSMINDIYNIYVAKAPFIPRKKEDFELTLKTSYCDIYVYTLNGKVMGYITYSPIKKRVNEICLRGDNFIPYCVKLIFDTLKLNEVTIISSPFDKDLVLELDKIAEEKRSTEQLHFRVYDMVAFIDMAIHLNRKIRDLPKTQRIYKIDGKNILIDIKKSSHTVCYTKSKASREFTSTEFLRYAFGLISLYDSDELFPLCLDLSYSDLF